VESSLGLACELLSIDEDKLQRDIDSWIGKYPDGRSMTVVQAADKRQISVLMENRALFPFFKLVMKHRRQYPEDSLAVHMLGQVGEVTDQELKDSKSLHPGDIVGRAGVEYTYDDYLKGKDGVRIIEMSAGGERIEELEGLFKYEDPEGVVGARPSIPGSDIYLTIDLALQRVVEGAFKWNKGSVIAMDPSNGEILAAVSRPAFDPNISLSGTMGEKWQDLYENPDKPLFNRTVQALYPPGSIFKLITGYAAVVNGLVSIDERLEPCFGGYQFGNRFFRCWLPEGHGSLSLSGALIYSCDTYFYQIGKVLSADQFAAAARLFGLGDVTGVDIPSEAVGIIPDHSYFDRRFGKRKWTKGHLLNYSIGQGEVLITPLQACVMVSVFANGGRMVHPHIVKRIVDADGIEVFEGEERAYPIQRMNLDILRVIRDLMERVIADERGTGRFAAVRGLRVAGKTGTAQNPHGEDHAIFVAFAPVESPELALAIVMENAGHGGVMAAPIAREIFSSYCGTVAGSGTGGALAGSMVPVWSDRVTPDRPGYLGDHDGTVVISPDSRVNRRGSE